MKKCQGCGKTSCRGECQKPENRDGTYYICPKCKNFVYIKFMENIKSEKKSFRVGAKLKHISVGANAWDGGFPATKIIYPHNKTRYFVINKYKIPKHKIEKILFKEICENSDKEILLTFDRTLGRGYAKITEEKINEDEVIKKINERYL